MELGKLAKYGNLQVQVCIEWHRTGAYYTAKLTFVHDFPVTVWVRIIQVCVSYSNFYGSGLGMHVSTLEFTTTDL